MGRSPDSSQDRTRSQVEVYTIDARADFAALGSVGLPSPNLPRYSSTTTVKGANVGTHSSGAPD